MLGRKILKLMFFGRTDLRIRLSRAKFDEEVDFEVRSAAAFQNSHQISEGGQRRPGTIVANQAEKIKRSLREQRPNHCEASPPTACCQDRPGYSNSMVLPLGNTRKDQLEKRIGKFISQKRNIFGKYIGNSFNRFIIRIIRLK